jgi:hypothetical protein
MTTKIDLIIELIHNRTLNGHPVPVAIVAANNQRKAAAQRIIENGHVNCNKPE